MHCILPISTSPHIKPHSNLSLNSSNSTITFLCISNRAISMMGITVRVGSSKERTVAKVAPKGQCNLCKKAQSKWKREQNVQTLDTCLLTII